MRVIERTMFYGVLNEVFIDLKKSLNRQSLKTITDLEPPLGLSRQANFFNSLIFNRDDYF